VNSTNFEDSCCEVIEDDLFGSSTLDPINGGSVKDIYIRRDYFEEETKYMVAMIAEDEANNKSPVSNIQEVFIPSTASTTPTSTTPTTSKIPCPEGWIDASYMDLGCIFFANRGFDWPEADRYCQDNSSALIEIYSQAHMDFIRSELFVLENFIGDHVWWTGGSDVGREGQWYWTHSLKTVDEFVWKENFPMGGTEREYLALANDSDYFGVDYKTDFKTGYPICQRV